jgi:seryl-tRNA(Sec) selenium transferase
MNFDWLANDLHCELLLKVVRCHIAFTEKVEAEVFIRVCRHYEKGLLADYTISQSVKQKPG